MFEFLCEQEGHQEAGWQPSRAMVLGRPGLTRLGAVIVYPGCVGDTQSAFPAFALGGCVSHAVYAAMSRICRNQPGALLRPTKLDRLGRSLEHLIELSRLLQARGVDLMVPCPSAARAGQHVR